MGMDDYSENCIVVEIAAEPGITEELKLLSETVRRRAHCDVVADFSMVDIITSSALAALLRLYKVVKDAGGKLILCAVADLTVGIFAVTGLENVFEFATDKKEALDRLRSLDSPGAATYGDGPSS